MAVKGPQGYTAVLETERQERPRVRFERGLALHRRPCRYGRGGLLRKIISRKRDTILAGDYSVYPRDVEEVLYENSKVMEVAVVGIPTEEPAKSQGLCGAPSGYPSVLRRSCWTCAESAWRNMLCRGRSVREECQIVCGQGSAADVDREMIVGIRCDPEGG